MGRVAWVAFERFSPRKLASALRPPDAGGGSFGPEPSPGSSTGLKLFIDAHAWISVPSTLKCSLDRSRFARRPASTADRNRAATSPASSRARFFENVE